MVSARDAVFNFIDRYYDNNDTFTAFDVYSVISHKNGSKNHLPTYYELARYLAENNGKIECIDIVKHKRYTYSKVKLYRKIKRD